MVLNGTFTSTTGTFAAAGGGINTVKSDGVTGDYTTGGSLTGWTMADVGTSQGLALLYVAGNQGSTSTNNYGVNLTGRFGSFSVWDPGNIAGATPSGGAIPNTSPGGGNFIAADGAAGYQVAFYQALTGLTPGATYAVSFWYAAAQQSGFTGNTTESWQVSLTNSAQLTQTTANGTTIQDTPAQPGGQLTSGAFQAWAADTMYFTASSASQVLTFLAMGTPAGQPPMDFLSDVTMSQTPEPASASLFAGGILLLVGIAWKRRDRTRAAQRSR